MEVTARGSEGVVKSLLAITGLHITGRIVTLRVEMEEEEKEVEVVEGEEEMELEKKDKGSSSCKTSLGWVGDGATMAAGWPGLTRVLRRPEVPSWIPG